MSATAWVAAAASEASRVADLTAGLIAHDRWSREELHEHQRTALRQLLEHATSASSYYREAVGPDAPSQPLEKLPTLTKATLVEQWDRIATDRRLRLADIEVHAASPYAAERYLNAFRVVCTSGSSGLRGLFVFDRREWEVWFAVHLRLFSRIGITAGTRLVAIGAPGPVHLTRQLFAGLPARMRGCAAPVGPDTVG